MCVRERQACSAIFRSARIRNRSMKKEAKSECETLSARLTISHASGFSAIYNTPPVSQLFLDRRVKGGREIVTSGGKKNKSLSSEGGQRVCEGRDGRAASLAATKGSLRKGLGPLGPEGPGP